MFIDKIKKNSSRKITQILPLSLFQTIGKERKISHL